MNPSLPFPAHESPLGELAGLERLEARPQSGFYVMPQEGCPLPVRAPSSPLAKPTAVGTADLITQIVRAVADPDAVPLGAALPDAALLPVAALRRSMASAIRGDASGAVTHVSPEGIEPLRREIAKREWNSGRAAYHDEIVVTCGASEALALALRATTEPGDVVVVESPTFFGVLQAIEALGRRALEVPTYPADGLDVDALESAIAAHPVRACVVTPNFQNPMGSCMPDAAKERLVSLAGAWGIPVIEDDTFGELFFEGTQPRSLRAWDQTNRVLRCGSFGKTLAPGYRVGWILPGPRHMEAVCRSKLASTFGTSVPPQLALARYLESGGYERHLRQLRTTLRDNVHRLSAEVAERFPKGTRTSRPSGGFLLWVEWVGGPDALDLYEQARSAGISICPGPIFSPRGAFRNSIRLSAGHPWSERTERALDTLSGFLRAGGT